MNFVLEQEKNDKKLVVLTIKNEFWQEIAKGAKVCDIRKFQGDIALLDRNKKVDIEFRDLNGTKLGKITDAWIEIREKEFWLIDDVAIYGGKYNSALAQLLFLDKYLADEKQYLMFRWGKTKVETYDPKEQLLEKIEIWTLSCCNARQELKTVANKTFINTGGCYIDNSILSFYYAFKAFLKVNGEVHFFIDNNKHLIMIFDNKHWEVIKNANMTNTDLLTVKYDENKTNTELLLEVYKVIERLKLDLALYQANQDNCDDCEQNND